MPEAKSTPDREHHKRFRCDRYAKMIQRQKMLRECKPLEEGLSALARAKILLSDEKAVRADWATPDVKSGRQRSPSVPSIPKTELPTVPVLPVKPLGPSSSLTSISYTSNIVFPTTALSTNTSTSRTNSLDANSKPTPTMAFGSLPSASSSPVKQPQHAPLHKTDALPIDADKTISASKSPGANLADFTFDSLPTSSFVFPKGATSTPIGSPNKSTLFSTPKTDPKVPNFLASTTPILPTSKPFTMNHAFGPSISSNSTDSGKFSFGGDKTPDSDPPKPAINTKSSENTPTNSFNGSFKTPEATPTAHPAQATPTKANLPLAVRWVRHQRAIFQKAQERLRPFLTNPDEAEFRNTLRVEVGDYIDHTLVKDVTNQHLTDFVNYFVTMLKGDAVVCRVRENKWFNFDRENVMHMAFLYDVICKRIFQMVCQDPTIIETATLLHGLLVVFRTYLANSIFLINLTVEDLVSVFTERTKKYPEPITVQSLPFERNLLKLLFTIEAANPVVGGAKTLSELQGLQLIHEFCIACQLPQVPVMTGAVLLEILQCAGTALSKNNCPYQRSTLKNLIPRLQALPNQSVDAVIDKICNNLLADIRVPLTQMHNVIRQKIIDKLAAIDLEPL
uniref:Nuclear pore complex protein Nup50 n=1 Tax=Panagrellus redivivus TaxID=6233 RepID=A0A7E4US09_PANRE